MTVNELVTAYATHLAGGSPQTVRLFAPLGRAIRAALGDRDHLNVSAAELKVLLFAATVTRGERARYVWLAYLRACWLYPERFLGAPQDPHHPFRTNGLRSCVPKPLPVHRAYLEPELVERIVARPTLPRPRLILWLLQDSAIRISELLRLEARDLTDAVAGSGDGRCLILRHPKSGQQEEVVALPPALGLAMRGYLAVHGLSAHDRLFPVSAQAVRNVLARAARKAGVHLTPHDLRRAWASTKRREGWPIGLIQAQLRHKSEATTRGYIAPIGVSELLKAQVDRVPIGIGGGQERAIEAGVTP